MMKFLRAALVAAFAFSPFADAVAGPFANRHIRSISDISAPILPTLDLDFANGEALDALVTFTRASPAWKYNSSGTLVEISSGVARVNSHVFDGANWVNRGLWIEEARTNSIFPNQDLTGTWVNINTDEPTTNNADPAGGTSAVEVAATSTADQQFAIYRSFTGLTAGQSTAISAFVKIGTNATFAQLVWDADGTGNDGAFCNFNLSTGASGSITAFAAGTATSCGVVDLGGDFYRLWIVAKIAAGTVGRLTIGVIDRIDAVGFEAADLADNDSIIPWGVQVELNEAVITSYMGETTSGTTTRAAEIVQVKDSNFTGFYNQPAGTFLIEATLPFVLGNQRFLSVSAGNPQRLILFKQASGNTRFLIITNSATQVDISGGSNWSDGDTRRIAGAYSLNDFALSTEATIIGTDTTGAPPTPTVLNIGRAVDGSGYINGFINFIQYWPVRLDNGYLIARSQ